MKKIVISVVLGGVLFFAASAAGWMLMPWKNHGMKKIPEETLVRDTLKVVVQEPGLYFFPSDQTANGTMDQKQHMEMAMSGPVGMLFYTPLGKNTMGKQMVIGLLQSFAIAGFCLWLLIMMRARITTGRERFLTILGLGFFVWFCTDLVNWNWMFHPGNYIFPVLLDHLFSFGILGLVLAKFTPEEN